MKNITRNDLWMMIVAWCLILNGYSILSIIVGIFASIYLIKNIKNKNILRILSLATTTFLVNTLLAFICNAHSFIYFPLFNIFVSINVALLNERLYKERLKALYPILLVMIISLTVFVCLTILLPSKYYLISVKANILSLTILIFIPYTSIMMISVIKKEFNLKRFIDKYLKKNIS